MKKSKQNALKLNSKVLFVFESKSATAKNSNDTFIDTTTGTITLTGTGNVFCASKERSYQR